MNHHLLVRNITIEVHCSRERIINSTSAKCFKYSVTKWASILWKLNLVDRLFCVNNFIDAHIATEVDEGGGGGQHTYRVIEVWCGTYSMKLSVHM